MLGLDSFSNMGFGLHGSGSGKFGGMAALAEAVTSIK